MTKIIYCGIYSFVDYEGFFLYRLSGYSPFAGETDHETFVNINRCDYDFDDEVWQNISAEARDFIKNLLIPDKRWEKSHDAPVQSLMDLMKSADQIST